MAVAAPVLTRLLGNLRRYVYDYIGGDHDKIFRELLATLCTFAVTTLWLGPCEVVYIWSVLNCFGLNFELWVAKLFSLPPFSTVEVSAAVPGDESRPVCRGPGLTFLSCFCLSPRVQRVMGEAMSRRVRGVFNAANFWAIVLYNVLSLNSLEFATLVGGRLVLKGNEGAS